MPKSTIDLVLNSLKFINSDHKEEKKIGEEFRRRKKEYLAKNLR